MSRTDRGPDGDFLIVGSGIAGLRAAIELGRYGTVLLASKGQPAESSTGFAQGGIAVSLGPNDSPDLHAKDSLEAGKGLCVEEAVWALVSEGVERVRELIKWGARFDRDERGYIFAREAAHSHARILRAHGDATGVEILRVLLQQVSRLPTVSPIEGYALEDLAVVGGICEGAWMRAPDQSLVLVRARTVLLATGGAGRLYLRTTNPSLTTGDGIAAAYRAGADVMDMEFVQFHPTALQMKDRPALLLTEAMRGEGALLRNESGEAFMARYHPHRELATRDTVSRAIWEEARKTRGEIYLDLTHLDARFVAERFPTIHRTCLGYGLDITRSPIPVGPAAHFMIGGVRTDLNGASSIPGLYAAGEVACNGAHGANRLASNSLLEGLVFGARAGEAARKWAESHTPTPSKIKPPSKEEGAGRRRNVSISIQNDLAGLMWENAGIVRSESSLREALQGILKLEERHRAASPEGENLEMKNLLLCARLVVESAVSRTQSIGAHFRTDSRSGGEAVRSHIVMNNSSGSSYRL